jgi:hypothetical protein
MATTMSVIPLGMMAATVINSLTPIDGRDRQFFNELHW